jgi:hypothetical protein
MLARLGSNYTISLKFLNAEFLTSVLLSESRGLNSYKPILNKFRSDLIISAKD